MECETKLRALLKTDLGCEYLGELCWEEVNDEISVQRFTE